MANDGDGLIKEFFATRERGYAWLFRVILLAALGVMGWMGSRMYDGIVGGQENMNKEFSHHNESVQKTIDKMVQLQQQNTNSITQLTTTLSDHIKNDTLEDQWAHQQDADKEQRLRNLESLEYARGINK